MQITDADHSSAWALSVGLVSSGEVKNNSPSYFHYSFTRQEVELAGQGRYADSQEWEVSDQDCQRVLLHETIIMKRLHTIYIESVNEYSAF